MERKRKKCSETRNYILIFRFNTPPCRNEYYGGGSYMYQNEKYARFSSFDKAQRFTSYRRAVAAHTSLFRSCVNVPCEFEVGEINGTNSYVTVYKEGHEYEEYKDGVLKGMKYPKREYFDRENGEIHNVIEDAAKTKCEELEGLTFEDCVEVLTKTENELREEKRQRTYEEECTIVMQMIGAKETERLFACENSVLAPRNLGSLTVYKGVAEFLAYNKTVIDFGCGQALQAIYFDNHAKYIGVDDKVICCNRLNQKNTSYYMQNVRDFIYITLPALNLDLNNVFAICAENGDKEAEELIRLTFPNCLVYSK